MVEMNGVYFFAFFFSGQVPDEINGPLLEQEELTL